MCQKPRARAVPVEYSPREFIWPVDLLRAGLHPLEDLIVAAEPEPFFSFPALVGAPAYARPPKAIREAERPFDPDDLPIVAYQTEDERAISLLLQPSNQGGSWGNGLTPIAGGRAGGSGTNGSGGVPARRFSLRAVTGRLGAREK